MLVATIAALQSFCRPLRGLEPFGGTDPGVSREAALTPAYFLSRLRREELLESIERAKVFGQEIPK
jgi:hypothetical protein